MTRLTKADILRLFELLDAELAKENTLGEIFDENQHPKTRLALEELLSP